VIGPEVSSLTLEEKYQILQAYMRGGGVQGLIEGGGEGAGTEDMDSEDERAVEE
jgi:hypothetical protein